MMKNISMRKPAAWLACVVGLMGIGARCSDGGATACELSAPGEAESCVARAKPPHNDLPRNGLSETTLSEDPLLLGDLADRSLEAGIQLHVGPIWGDAAAGAGSTGNADLQELMKYIVSCALDPELNPDSPSSHAVTVNTPDGPTLSLQGELGLCGERSPYGDWSKGPASPECQEIVSACVLARVNALGSKVIISVRGEPSGEPLCSPLPLQPKVPVEEWYRENRGTRITSFDKCGGGTPGDHDRNCGWVGRYVGACKPDSQVTVTANSGVMLRVCKGIYGCYSSTDQTPPYAGPIGSVLDGAEGVQFQCPNHGIRGSKFGYYAVMLASPDPNPNVTLAETEDVTVETEDGPWGYPAPETDVFTYREGAFYGNIFATAPSSNLDVMLYDKQYACFSDVWSNGFAHLTHRECADPNRECFANDPGPCNESPPAIDGGIYGECNGWKDWRTSNRRLDSETWLRPITVYLNHPCDFIDFTDVSVGQRQCQTAFNSFNPQDPNDW